MNFNSFKPCAAVRLAVGALAMSGAACALALPKGVAQGPSVEGITEYRLANGLRVLLFPDASGRPSPST
jgi:zinc protease